jgi:hypothetical protein
LARMASMSTFSPQSPFLLFIPFKCNSRYRVFIPYSKNFIF